jgi:hypothetical protein
MATETEESILLAKSATDVLLYDVNKDSFKLLTAASQRAHGVFARLLTDPDFEATAEDFAALSKLPFKPESATADAVRKSRLALTVPRAGAFFIPAQGKQWTVSTPSSPFLGLGKTKGCGGPNVVQPLFGPIDEAPLNVMLPSLLESVPALEKAVAACEASLQRVLEAYAMQIDGTSLLDPECKSVLLKLLEVFRAGTSTAEYGFEVLAMFQCLGDATFPYPHFQQMLRITRAEKVAEALSEYFDTEQVHAAVRAYCTALANYADSMAATYRAKFVPLKEALRVAQSMAVIVFDFDETLVHASDVEIESEAPVIEVTWNPDPETMGRYKKRVSEKNPAHLKLKLGGPDGDTATSTIHVSRARMGMLESLLRDGRFQSAYFASANNNGRTYALNGELREHFEWVHSVEIIPREKFMVGECDLRDQKKSIAAIRAAVGVPDDVVVVMVDDKAGAVVGAGARDALVAVRPFMGNDAELDATEERSLEREIREIAERAARARECKRKREVTAE